MVAKAECQSKPGPNGTSRRIMGEITVGAGVERIQIKHGDEAIIGSNGPIYEAPKQEIFNRQNGYAAI